MGAQRKKAHEVAVGNIIDNNNSGAREVIETPADCRAYTIDLSSSILFSGKKIFIIIKFTQS